jgi:hypothetical protein
MNTADPSLNAFLGTDTMQSLFSDFDGFPAAMEQESFDYINYNAFGNPYS